MIFRFLYFHQIWVINDLYFYQEFQVEELQQILQNKKLIALDINQIDIPR